MTFLAFPSAFDASQGSVSEEVFAGTGGEQPLLSIVIPTYRRSDMLAEAVRSAIGQDFAQPFEVVVVDDDSMSLGHKRLRDTVPEIAQVNFRYLRNRANLGMYPNMNRCVVAARGEWVTILHDDDLLDPNFAQSMFDILDHRPAIRGLISRKRTIDERSTGYRQSRLKRLVRPLLHLWQFAGRRTRRIRPPRLFWGSVLGNTVGFVCRKADVQAIGGFNPAEHPVCDHFFFTRFAAQFRLEQTSDMLAAIRVADNSLLNKETQLVSLRGGIDLQRAMVGVLVPDCWRRLTPLIAANHVANTSRHWRSNITQAEAEAAIGIKLPRDRPALLFAIRALLRGF